MSTAPEMSITASSTGNQSGAALASESDSTSKVNDIGPAGIRSETHATGPASGAAAQSLAGRNNDDRENESTAAKDRTTENQHHGPSFGGDSSVVGDAFHRDDAPGNAIMIVKEVIQPGSAVIASTVPQSDTSKGIQEVGETLPTDSGGSGQENLEKLRVDELKLQRPPPPRDWREVQGKDLVKSGKSNYVFYVPKGRESGVSVRGKDTTIYLGFSSAKKANGIRTIIGQGHDISPKGKQNESIVAFILRGGEGKIYAVTVSPQAAQTLLQDLLAQREATEASPQMDELIKVVQHRIHKKVMLISNLVTHFQIIGKVLEDIPMSDTECTQGGSLPDSTTKKFSGPRVTSISEELLEFCLALGSLYIDTEIAAPEDCSIEHSMTGAAGKRGKGKESRDHDSEAEHEREAVGEAGYNDGWTNLDPYRFAIAESLRNENKALQGQVEALKSKVAQLESSLTVKGRRDSSGSTANEKVSVDRIAREVMAELASAVAQIQVIVQSSEKNWHSTFRGESEKQVAQFQQLKNLIEKKFRHSDSAEGSDSSEASSSRKKPGTKKRRTKTTSSSVPQSKGSMKRTKEEVNAGDESGAADSTQIRSQHVSVLTKGSASTSGVQQQQNNNGYGGQQFGTYPQYHGSMPWQTPPVAASQGQNFSQYPVAPPWSSNAGAPFNHTHGQPGLMQHDGHGGSFQSVQSTSGAASYNMKQCRNCGAVTPFSTLSSNSFCLNCGKLP